MGVSKKKPHLKYIIKGTEVYLDHSASMYIPKYNVLMLSDLHIGKISHFRKKGIALPKKGEKANFKKLQNVIVKYKPTDIFIIGDLFHSVYNKMWRNWISFIHKYEWINFHLVTGNHDILPTEIYEKSGMILHSDSVTVGDFILRHHPVSKSSKPNKTEAEQKVICGHIHPGVSLSFRAGIRKTLPCFYEDDHQLILPSFGIFTGKVRMKTGEAKSIHVISDQNIIRIK